MSTTLKNLRGVLATAAVLVILASQSMQEFVEPGDRTTPMVIAFLAFFSVAFLHWLLARYATAFDLFSTAARDQLRAVGESGSQRGFFGVFTAIGYLEVIAYSVSVARFPSPTAGPTPLEFLFLGIVFLFLGLLARARGVVQFLISSRCESLQPSAAASAPGVTRAADPIR